MIRLTWCAIPCSDLLTRHTINNQDCPPAQKANGENSKEASSLRKRAMRGSAWTIAGYLINNFLRLGSNLVLAYALFPEAFAIVAYASIALQGLEMFSDIGIGPAIVQSPRGSDPIFLNTAWTLQIIRGLLLFTATFLLGFPVAWFYNEPSLAWVIPVTGLNFVINGLQSTSVHTCSRAINLSRLTIWGLIEAILKAAITITWALLWPSVWALIGGALISYTVGMFLTHTILPGIRNRLCWERKAVQSILRFGGWVFLSTMMTFLANQADRLILGKLVPMGVVGVYGIALMFARLPYDIGSRLAGSVLFPVLASIIQEDRSSFHRKFLKSRDLILAISQFGIVTVIIASPWFFNFVYDPRYKDASFLAPLLGGVVWFSILQSSADRALLALGDTHILAISNFCNLVFSTSGCLAGYYLAGMKGFVAGIALGNLAGHSVVSWALGKRNLSIIAQDLRYTVLIAMAFFLGTIPSLAISGLSIQWSLLFAAIGLTASAIVAYQHVMPLVAGPIQNFFHKIGQKV